jgi:hypothetical protein
MLENAMFMHLFWKAKTALEQGLLPSVCLITQAMSKGKGS